MLELKDLDVMIEEKRNSIKDHLERKLQFSDRLVISMNKMGTIVKSIKASDLVLFKDNTEELTLGDILVEYKVLVDCMVDLLEDHKKLTEELNSKYDNLANQFLKLLEIYKHTHVNVEMIKSEVL